MGFYSQLSIETEQIIEQFIQDPDLDEVLVKSDDLGIKIEAERYWCTDMVNQFIRFSLVKDGKYVEQFNEDLPTPLQDYRIKIH
jgi:hypothetical protein